MIAQYKIKFIIVLSMYLLKRDWLEVYDGSDENAEKLGRFCGHNPGQISSSGSSLLLWFHSAE